MNIADIKSQIQSIMKLNGDWHSSKDSYNIDYSIENFTSKANINITNPIYKVDLAIVISKDLLLGLHHLILFPEGRLVFFFRFTLYIRLYSRCCLLHCVR